MVTAAWDTSNLVALYKDGKQCTSCCAGEPCEHCDVSTPATIFLQITGAVDNKEGACVCVFYTGGDMSSKFEGMAADDVLNNVIVECTQTDYDPCKWVAYVALDAATLKKYGNDCAPLDCTGAIETRKMCWLFFEVDRKATQTTVQIFILGEEDPGDYTPAFPIRSCGIYWIVGVSEAIDCDGDKCVCCEKEGGAAGRYWDLTNATIRTWSTLCNTMHVNDVTASISTAGCGGDEEKIQVAVTIHDSDDAVLENAHVKIILTGEVEDVVYADTDAFGIATYLSDCLCINGTINVEITKITKGGYIWDSNDDEDSLTDSIVMDCV